MATWPAMSETAPARPQAYDGFGGEARRIFSTSTSWWPARPDPGADAPNVIVMLVDDLGFSDAGCFGSEIDTPNIDALAAGGVRFSNFHVNPMCSPTRASLLTGLNPHMAGVGHVAHADPGFPGYAMELRDDAVTMADVFCDSGWATFCVGKWHLCKDSDNSMGGSKKSWPLQVGFERYYGILDGFTNFHQPHQLFEDNRMLDIDEFDDDYYFTDDLTDQAIGMIRQLRTNHPHKPFFLYFAHGAVHAPLQAKQTDMAKYEGKYAAGWDVIREQRLARQKELGVVPEHAELPPRNHEPEHAVPAWDDLTDDERKLFARYQEIYAAMVDSVDQNLGRLRAELEASGEWDNTIVVFTSDNGASREGDGLGTSQYFEVLLSKAGVGSTDDIGPHLDRFDLLGGPQTLPHYPMGWAMAGNTPFRLYKVNTHQGGQQVPLIISWPERFAEAAGQIRTPYQHVTDILPTLADLLGLEIPAERHGRPSPELAGASFAGAVADAAAGSTHPEQMYENWGHRGIYRDGWSAVTVHQPATAFSTEPWELHDLRADPTELHDLAADHPAKLAEMVAAWDEAAWANQVFPVDERSMLKELIRPPYDEVLTEPVTIRPGTASLDRYRSLQLITFRSCNISADLSWSRGQQGTIVAHGDQGGGYGLYVVDGELLLVYNAYGHMHEHRAGPPVEGAQTIELDLVAPGGLTYDLSVRVDGEDRGGISQVPMVMAMAPFQGIDVGVDRRSPVSWSLYEKHRTFAFEGAISSVTYTPGAFAPDAPHNFLDMAREMHLRYE